MAQFNENPISRYLIRYNEEQRKIAFYLAGSIYGTPSRIRTLSVLGRALDWYIDQGYEPIIHYDNDKYHDLNLLDAFRYRVCAEQVEVDGRLKTLYTVYAKLRYPDTPFAEKLIEEYNDEFDTLNTNPLDLELDLGVLTSEHSFGELLFQYFQNSDNNYLNLRMLILNAWQGRSHLLRMEAYVNDVGLLNNNRTMINIDPQRTSININMTEADLTVHRTLTETDDELVNPPDEPEVSQTTTAPEWTPAIDVDELSRRLQEVAALRPNAIAIDSDTAQILTDVGVTDDHLDASTVLTMIDGEVIPTPFQNTANLGNFIRGTGRITPGPYDPADFNFPPPEPQVRTVTETIREAARLAPIQYEENYTIANYDELKEFIMAQFTAYFMLELMAGVR